MNEIIFDIEKISRKPFLVVADNDKNVYDYDLNPRRINDISQYSERDILDIYTRLTKIHKIDCKILNVNIYIAYFYDDKLMVRPNGEIHTSKGDLDFNINFAALEQVTGETGLGISFLKSAVKKGHTHLIRVIGRATILKKHLKNINVDADSISYSSSWASGPEDLIDTLFMMEKKSKKIYDIKEIVKKATALKRQIYKDVSDDGKILSQDVDNDKLLGESPFYKTSNYVSFFVYDTKGILYNQHYRPQKHVSLGTIYDAFRIYFKLKSSGIDCKIGRASGYVYQYMIAS